MGRRTAAVVFLFGILLAKTACAPLVPLVVSGQRTIEVRSPEELPHASLPDVPPPETVSFQLPTDVIPDKLSLDDCITIALTNSQVVRVLAGTGAVASGQTIYDPAISNTSIDEAKAVFDPVLNVNNTWSRDETPQGFVQPNAPVRAQIAGTRVDQYNLDFGLSKANVIGGVFSMGVTDNRSRFRPGIFPINPQHLSAISIGYTQPLLKGAGIVPNVAPIVLARINTERSYFQFKASMQELVRGVIEAYWAVVFARTDVWAREQQVKQAEFAYKRAAARQRVGFASRAEVAQAKSALANFRANLIGARGNLLQREAALRNILGLPPTVPPRFEPITPPLRAEVVPEWQAILRLAEENRPDIIELKLILEADQQNLAIARNQARPQVDLTLRYQWDGLSGRTPALQRVVTNGGEFTDWSLGVNFSVPLGLRQGRAQLRNRQLLILRDQANLQQGMHGALHLLAQSVRNLAQFYQQYKAFQEARVAARENLEQQAAEYRAGRAILLNVLQAIGDWGNAVSAEAQALSQYNTELATLELETGTILETHGIVFAEERFGSIGPLGRLTKPWAYPESIVPVGNEPCYPVSDRPADQELEKELPRFPTIKSEPAPKPRRFPDD
ncbi:MAG: type I secretion outer membrane protein [Gemmatales bacterium]|nr:MAG: type I secretion outer membrane protein [Gemmatales bacterium]